MSLWRSLLSMLGLASADEDERSGAALELDRQRETLTRLASERAEHEARISALAATRDAAPDEATRARIDTELEQVRAALAGVQRRQQGLARLRDRAEAEPPAIESPNPPRLLDRTGSDLAGALQAHTSAEGRAARAGAALAQLERAEAAHGSYVNVLASRLNPGELTHVRYESAARQVMEGVQANLRAVAEALALVAEAEDHATGSGGHGGANDAVTSGLQRIDERLAENDDAIAGLLTTTQSITAMRPLDDTPDTDLDDAMAALEELAKRAHRYR